MNFLTIKRWYECGLWTELMVRQAVKQSVLTKEQFKGITGKDF